MLTNTRAARRTRIYIYFFFFHKWWVAGALHAPRKPGKSGYQTRRSVNNHDYIHVWCLVVVDFFSNYLQYNFRTILVYTWTWNKILSYMLQYIHILQGIILLLAYTICIGVMLMQGGKIRPSETRRALHLILTRSFLYTVMQQTASLAWMSIVVVHIHMYNRPPIYFALTTIIIILFSHRVPSSESPGTRVMPGYIIPVRLWDPPNRPENMHAA